MSAIVSADLLSRLLLGNDVPFDRLEARDLLRTLDEHDLLSLVYHAARASDRLRHWPGELHAAVTARAREDAARELVRRREIVAALEALSAADVRPILLKGTALAYSVYDSPSTRPRCDTDLLIPRRDVATADRVMRTLGYQRAVACDGELLFQQFTMQKRDRFGIDHAFDFHWKLSTQPVFADVLTYQELCSEASLVPALGIHARGTGLVHALLLACMHPVMHHRNVERLIWIYDVHLLASRLSARDADRFVDIARMKRVAAVCARELGLARMWFHTRVADGLIERLERTVGPEPSAAYLASGRRWLDDLRSSIAGLNTWRDRARLLLDVLFPRADYMLASYGLQSSRRALLPALYAHRTLRGIWRVATGRK